jgi:uncharacterized damage-inducible protein DinB
MKRFARSIFLLAVPALLLSSAGAARAQEGAQPKTPPTPAQAILENWNDVGDRLITMAQDWPEEKYTYKLTPAVRTFQEVILHIAGSNYDLINHLAGTKVGDAQNDPPVSQYKTKAETVAYLRKSVVDGAAQLQKEGDAEALKHLSGWVGYTEHMGEHYGLLVAYYRATGGVPPESRAKK